MLTSEEMPKRGGTLTVLNVGAIGVGDFALGVLVPGGKLLKVGISWSGDHRVVEGAELARLWIVGEDM